MLIVWKCWNQTSELQVHVGFIMKLTILEKASGCLADKFECYFASKAMAFSLFVLVEQCLVETIPCLL